MKLMIKILDVTPMMSKTTKRIIKEMDFRGSHLTTIKDSSVKPSIAIVLFMPEVDASSSVSKSTLSTDLEARGSFICCLSGCIKILAIT